MRFWKIENDFRQNIGERIHHIMNRVLKFTQNICFTNTANKQVPLLLRYPICPIH